MIAPAQLKVELAISKEREKDVERMVDERFEKKMMEIYAKFGIDSSRLMDSPKNSH